MQSAYDSSFAYEQGDTTSPRTADQAAGPADDGHGHGASRGAQAVWATRARWRGSSRPAAAKPGGAALRGASPPGREVRVLPGRAPWRSDRQRTRHRQHPDSAPGPPRPSVEGLSAAHRRQGGALLAVRRRCGSNRQRRRGSRNGSRIGLDPVARRDPHASTRCRLDHVLMAISLGALPRICAELIAASPAGKTMVDLVPTVRTQAW